MVKRSGMPSVLVALGSAMALGGCVWQSDYDALQAKYNQSQQQLSATQAQLSAQQTQVGRLQGAIIYTVESDLLFAPGSWTIKPRGRDVMADIAHKLAPTQQSKLIVTGYTDSAPIGPGLRREGVTSNQQLSEKRAQAVVDFLVTQGVKPDMVSAQGAGDANPVASNSTPQGRAKNRRGGVSTVNSPPGALRGSDPGDPDHTSRGSRFMASSGTWRGRASLVWSSATRMTSSAQRR